MMEDRQHAYKTMREVQGEKVQPNAQMYKPLTQNVQARWLGWYFDPRITLGISHNLRSFWAGPYRVMKLIASALVKIKLVYYPGEEKLVSLDVLKLYHGEDVVCQNPEDVDLD